MRLQNAGAGHPWDRWTGRRLPVVLAVLTLVGGWLVATPRVDAEAVVGVDVCHVDERGAFKLIRVAEPAVPAHLGHGDGLPGDPIPGMDDYEFDSSCGAVPRDSDDDGVIDGDDNCPLVPNADQLDQYGSSAGDACEDTDADGTPDVAEEHMCVSVNGVLVVSNGTAVCNSLDGGVSTPNVAVANGDEAHARAGIDPGDAANEVTAVGDFAVARTTSGLRNTAVATGSYAQAVVGGTDNVAEAVGDGAGAAASGGAWNIARAEGLLASAVVIGDHNHATAIGERAEVWILSGTGNTAVGDGTSATVLINHNSLGDDNTAIATGDGAFAGTLDGSDNRAEATGTDAQAVAGHGDSNTALATGDRSVAFAHYGDRNTAIAEGPDSSACAGNGNDDEIAVNVDLCTP